MNAREQLREAWVAHHEALARQRDLHAQWEAALTVEHEAWRAVRNAQEAVLEEAVSGLPEYDEYEVRLGMARP